MSVFASIPPARVVLIPQHEKWIVYCVAFAAFSFQFEAFLVSVALPDMAREMLASSTAISFVVISYLLAASMSFLPAGRLGDRYGFRRVFFYGGMLACAGTVLSGLSVNVLMLCGSRFLQGVGMGALVAVSYAMIPAWIHKERLGWGYGMLSLGAGVGMIAGIPVGGLLSHYLSWQWIFLASVPVLLMLLALAYRHLPRQASAQLAIAQRSTLDWTGLLLFGFLVSALMLSISLGAEFGWTSRWILSLLLMSAILAAVLFWRAHHGQSILSGSLFRCQGFALALLTLFLFQFVSTGVRFLMPFYLELSVGLSVLMSSAFMLTYPIAFAPTAVWAGRLADRIGSHWMVLGAIGMSALICGLYANVVEQNNIWMFCLFIFCFGVLCALFSPPNNRLMMMAVPEKDRSEASALLPVALNMGSLLGISVFETVFSLGFPLEMSQSLQSLTVSQEAQPLILYGFKQALILASLILFSTFIYLFAKRTRQNEMRAKDQ